MYKRIAAVFDETYGGLHALTSAVSLAKILGAEVQTITVVGPLSVSASYAGAVPLLSQVLSDDRVKFYEELQETAMAEGRKSGVAIRTHLVAGDEVEAIVEFLRQEKMDLLVIGLHTRTPRIARLWSTVFEVEQEAPCSVLGVH